MARGVSGASASSGRSGALSPLAPSYVRPSFLGEQRPTFGSPSMFESPGKEAAVPQVDDALFFVDTVGEPAAATFAENDEEESDTEELWPRKRETEYHPQAAAPAPDTTSATVFPSLVTKQANGQRDTSRTSAIDTELQAAHIPTKPYARVITDDMPIEKLFRPFLPELSASARDFVSAATATGPSGKQDKARKVSKKRAKREAKERKKERRSNKKADRRALKASFATQPKRPRANDSDVEWGSDGPPSMSEDEAVSDDDDILMEMTASSSHINGKITAHANGRRKGGKGDAAIEAALADYAANMKNHPEELAALKAFAKGMSGREQLTIGDLEDIADITDSDEDGISNDEAYEERVIIKDFVKAQGRAEAKMPESFPVYVPGTRTSESEPDDTIDEAWGTDEGDPEDASNSEIDLCAEAGLPGEEDGSTTTSSEDEDYDDNGVIQTTIEETILIVSEDEDDDESEDDRAVADMEDEEIDDILFAATKPARRKRQAPAPSGADEIDELLQNQWRKDREKKAIKRQERALARLERKPSKANSKKAKRAAAKARGFRDNDGDFGSDLDLAGGNVPQFHKINEDLRDFIENSGLGEYALPAMSKQHRVAIHLLAEAYKFV